VTIEIFFIFALSIILIALCVLPPLRELMAGRFDPMDPRTLFLAYYALQLGVYPVYVLIAGKDFKIYDVAAVDDQRIILTALALSIAGLGSFLLGDSYVRKSRLFRVSAPSYALGTRSVMVLMTFGVPFALYGIYSMYLSGGGIGRYLDSFVETRYGGTGRGYMSFIATSFVCVLAVIAFVTSLRSSLPKIWRWGAYTLFFLSIVSAGLSGFRATMIPIIIAAIMCVHYYVKRFTIPAAVLLFAGLVAFATGYAVVRAQVEARSAALDIDAMGRVTVVDGLLTRSPGIELVATTVEGIRRNADYALFYPALFESATILIPRALWAGKPTPQSILYGEQFMSYFLFLRDGSEVANTGGFSMTVVGYLYWQLGTLAVLFGMFVIGMFFGYVYRLFISRPNCQVTAVIYLIYGSIMAKFAEAPQDTMNAIVILSAFVFVALSVSAHPLGSKIRATPARQPL
jgi:hypothetical protein